MRSDEEVRAIISDLESDRIERTVSAKDRNKIRQAVCAFANDYSNSGVPGYFLVGVRDDGTLDGLECTDDLLKDLAAIRSEGRILPLPAMEVYCHSYSDGDVAVIEVSPAQVSPVRFDGRVWIRVGPTKAIASPADERRLIERAASATKTFDAQPAIDAALDDLALDLFTLSYRSIAIADDVLEANDRPLEQQLAALGFFDRRTHNPTNAGVLLFGKDPRRTLPGAYVQLVRIDGTALTDDIVTDNEVSGDLATVVRETEQFLDLHIPSRPVPTDGFREDRSTVVPQFVLRELFLNAVMHRDYQSTKPIRVYLFADHIEIQNPGGLYGEATRRNFPNVNAYRNPIIADALKTLGFVNRFGRGVLRAQELLQEHGNPPAQFQLDTHTITVEVRYA